MVQRAVSGDTQSTTKTTARARAHARLTLDADHQSDTTTQRQHTRTTRAAKISREVARFRVVAGRPTDAQALARDPTRRAVTACTIYLAKTLKHTSRTTCSLTMQEKMACKQLARPQNPRSVYTGKFSNSSR